MKNTTIPSLAQYASSSKHYTDSEDLKEIFKKDIETIKKSPQKKGKIGFDFKEEDYYVSIKGKKGDLFNVKIERFGDDTSDTYPFNPKMINLKTKTIRECEIPDFIMNTING